MMEPESLDTVLREIEGWTSEEWEMVRMRIDEHFDQKKREVEFGEDGRMDVRRRIAADNGWPVEPGTPKKTRMGF